MCLNVISIVPDVKPSLNKCEQLPDSSSRSSTCHKLQNSNDFRAGYEVSGGDGSKLERACPALRP